MILNNAVKLIKTFESLHDGDLTHIGLQPKQCPAGIWTVGYGGALSSKDDNRVLKGAADKAEAYAMFPNLTEAQALFMLSVDLAHFEAGVDRLVKVPLTDDQRGALVSFAYNCGLGNLASSTLLRMLNKGLYKDAADQFLRWNKAGGKVLRGLTRRRKCERSLFLSEPFSYEGHG